MDAICFGIAGMDEQLLIGAGIVVAALFAILLGRVGGRYGKIEPSQNVTEAYESFRVNPDQRYYISGSDVSPNAVIGIDKAWTLESDLWKSRDLDSGGLKELVCNMRSRGPESNASLCGFMVFDNRGGIIGDLFSSPGLHMPVRIRGAYRVVIDTPPLDLSGQS